MRKISPLGKIPVYQEGNLTLPDSSVICAYVERKHPEPALDPADPYEYARALWLEEYGDTALYSVIGGKIFAPRVLAPALYNQKPDEAAIEKVVDEELPPLFDYLESQIESSDGMAGGRFSIANIALITQFLTLRYAGYAVDAGYWAKLARYVSRNLGRLSFQKAVEEERRAYSFLPEVRA